MKVLWSPRAVRHLVALRSHIAKNPEQSAALVAERIARAVDLLAKQPEMGRPSAWDSRACRS
jgi:plasmid stabilization system protein ParE